MTVPPMFTALNSSGSLPVSSNARLNLALGSKYGYVSNIIYTDTNMSPLQLNVIAPDNSNAKFASY